MMKIKFELRQIENVLLFKILKQEGFPRGFSFIAKNGLKIRIEGQPEIRKKDDSTNFMSSVATVFLRGKIKKYDDVTVSVSLEDEEMARKEKQRIYEAFCELFSIESCEDLAKGVSVFEFNKPEGIKVERTDEQGNKKTVYISEESAKALGLN